jgi:hypothetical protein
MTDQRHNHAEAEFRARVRNTGQLTECCGAKIGRFAPIADYGKSSRFVPPEGFWA